MIIKDLISTMEVTRQLWEMEIRLAIQAREEDSRWDIPSDQNPAGDW